MGSTEKYFQAAAVLLETILAEEKKNLHSAAGRVAESTAAGGIIHLFGAGHSVIPALEVYIRSSTLSNTRPVHTDPELDRFERIEGTGTALMQGFDGLPGEVLFVFSNSGVNPLPVEVALAGRDLGLYTIGVSSLSHSANVAPKHSSGKRLYEIVDLAIDSHVPYGDASLELDGLKMRYGPLSTIANVLIIDSIMSGAVELLFEQGITPPVRISRNTPGGLEHNRTISGRYAERIPGLRM